MTSPTPIDDGPHQGQPLTQAGAPLHRAEAAVILLHGRGATAEGMLPLAEAFAQPDVAYLAPRAAGRTWYPYSFLAPLRENEPGLSSGLRVVADLVARMEGEGVPAERVVLLGFSQGACLAVEAAARHARRYGGVVALSGALIGTGECPGRRPPDDKAFDYDGDLAGTPIFLGCSDADPHIPRPRVRRSSEVLRALGGAVEERIYPGMGHAVNEDEVQYVRGLLAALQGHSEYPSGDPPRPGV